MTDGVPDIFRAAAEWAHDELGDERIAGCAGCPAERRLRAEDGTMILVCHASPGSQTAGFDKELDPNVVIERARPDRRPGHRLRPHPPPRGPRPRLEADRQRRLGGLRLRRRPDGVVGTDRHRRRRGDRRDPPHRVRRARGRQRDLRARPARRRLSRGHGPHREARPMTEAGRAGRGDRDGAGDRARQRRRVDLGRPGRRPVGGAHHRGVRPVAAVGADRRRGPRLRRERPARPQGAPAHRPLHPVRTRRRARGARPGGPAGAVRGRARRADRGDPRDRPRRGRDADRRVHDERPARPRPDQPVPDPDGHPEHRGRPGRHPVRDDRAQLHDRVRLRDRRPRARRIERDHPPRRRRRHGRGRHRGRRLRGDRRRLRGDARAVDPERRPGGGVAPVRHRARRVRHRRGCGRRHPRGARARRVPRRDDPRRARRLRRDRRCLAHHAAGARRHRGGAGGQPGAREGGAHRRRHRPRQRPRDLDARGRQGRAPGDQDDLRRRAPGRSRSRPTSRCSGIRWAPPARSRRSSRS